MDTAVCAPVDRQRLAEFLARLSQLVSDHSDIAEIDINPPLVARTGSRSWMRA